MNGDDWKDSRPACSVNQTDQWTRKREPDGWLNLPDTTTWARDKTDSLRSHRNGQRKEWER